MSSTIESALPTNTESEKKPTSFESQFKRENTSFFERHRALISVVISCIFIALLIITIILGINAKHHQRQNQRQHPLEPEDDSGYVDENGTKRSKLNYMERGLEEEALVKNVEKIEWKDVIGQEKAKQALHECAIWPRERPQLFVGPRAPPRGILLFGPPGTGKTMLGKAVAANLKVKFYLITASSVGNMLFGQSEKIVKAIFTLAEKQKDGAVIFFDEIDSIMGSRGGANEHEANRKIKTEFLTTFDGVSTKKNSKVLVIAATNRPYDLDEAVLRRFAKRIRVDLPQKEGIKSILQQSMRPVPHNLAVEEFDQIATEAVNRGYNASDLTYVTKYAAMQPIRRLASGEYKTIGLADPRLVVTKQDYMDGIKAVQTSVNDLNKDILDEWEKKHAAD